MGAVQSAGRFKLGVPLALAHIVNYLRVCCNMFTFGILFVIT